MRIDYEALKESLREQVTVEDIVDYYGIDKKGRAFRCPGHLANLGHEDRNIGNCFIYPGGAAWGCCSCGAHGDIFSLVMELDGCSFPDAVNTIADIAGIDKTDFRVSKASLQAAKKRKEIQNLKPFWEEIGLAGNMPANQYAGNFINGQYSKALNIKNVYLSEELDAAGGTYDSIRKCYFLNGHQFSKYTSEHFEGTLWAAVSPVNYSLQQFKKDCPEEYRELILLKVQERTAELDNLETWAVKNLKSELYKAFLEVIKSKRTIIQKGVAQL